MATPSDPDHPFIENTVIHRSASQTIAGWLVPVNITGPRQVFRSLVSLYYVEMAAACPTSFVYASTSSSMLLQRTRGVDCCQCNQIPLVLSRHIFPRSAKNPDLRPSHSSPIPDVFRVCLKMRTYSELLHHTSLCLMKTDIRTSRPL